MFHTAAEWHAALNDLPPALFLASLIFDLAGSVTKREGLKAAGFWTLIGAGVGAVLALTSGLMAERVIAHGAAVHEIMERHELFGKITVFGIVGLALWRGYRRGALAGAERAAYLGLATVASGLVLYVAHLGGTIVFRHGGGVPTEVLEAAIAERAAGHEHAPGEEHEHDDHDHAEEVDGTAPGAQASPGDTGHTHPPGTPPHEH